MIFFSLFSPLGLQLAPLEPRPELLSVLTTHRPAAFHKTGWVPADNTNLDQEHLPQVLYALGESLFRPPAAEN